MNKPHSPHDASVATLEIGEEPALHRAVRARNLAACAALLQEGASPNALSGAGQTPLHCAIDVKSLAICTCLLQAGARFSYAPEPRDPAYLTPFQYASQKRWLDGLRLFLSTQGGDPCAARIWHRD